MVRIMTDALSPQNIITVLTASGMGAIIIEIIRAIRQRKKMGADYADVISSAAVRLLTSLEKRTEDLEAEVHKVTTERREIQDRYYNTERHMAGVAQELAACKRRCEDMAQILKDERLDRDALREEIATLRKQLDERDHS